MTDSGSPLFSRALSSLTLRRKGAPREETGQRIVGLVPDQREGRGCVEPSVIERAAGDRAGDFSRVMRDGIDLVIPKQHPHVIERGQATGGNDRNRDFIGKRDGGLEIEAAEHAVARHVGVNNSSDASVLEALGDVERGKLGRLRPAFDRNLAVAHIESHGNVTRIGARGLLHQRRIAHRRGADDDARDALFEPGFDRRAVADAAAKLHGDFHRGEDALDGTRVHRLAGKGAVEIDDMEIFETLPFECFGLRGGIAVEQGGARHVALLQAHRLAVLEIDRWEQNHGFHFKKLAISASPNFWLFSGWNCVPRILSRATIAVIGPPYAASATRSAR